MVRRKNAVVMVVVAVLLTVSVVLGIGGLVEPVRALGDDICEDLLNGDEHDKELAEAAGCNTTTNAGEFANNIIAVVLSFMGVLAVGVIIYGGYVYMMSAGDAARTYQGRNIILYGVVGLVVTLLASAIVAFIAASVN